ncbi:MAG TPA: TetR/AcrR family transcriptional regulator [bacterium]|jgi:AcrR family transcriptional regulator|nr:TetR/AcrR family transcriptional regulator [bacterium]
MTRPAGDAKKRLIEAGKEILEETGFSGLSVRAVAARAGVNLGLVSYHFGGKAAFVHQVAQELYDEFFLDFSLQVEGENDPLAALRKGLLRLARFVRDRRRMVRSLLKDLTDGDAEAKRFVLTNVPRHGIILAGLVHRCQDEGRLAKLPVPVAMTTLMGVVVFPTLVAEPIARAKFGGQGPSHRKMIEDSLLTDGALELRVDLALKALKP